MATIEHSTLSTGEIHEPKGAATASSGEVYVANGSGSGTWTPADSHIAGYIAFDASTPAYQHSTTTSDTVLDPTFSVASSKNFSGASTPNARLVYDGTDDVYGALHFVASVKQASGGDRELELALFKNGVELNGTRSIMTIESGKWGTFALNSITSLSTNDYLEVFIKADSAHTTDFAGAKLAIQCFPG